jgi:hypothetical protein
VFTVDTTQTGVSTSTQFAVPVEATSTFPFDVKENDIVIKTITAVGDNVVEFGSSGVKTISIDAPIDGWRFNNGGDRLKMGNVVQWGPLKLGNANGYFYGCENLTVSASAGVLSLVGTTNMLNAFYNCKTLNTDNLNTFDYSAVSRTDNMLRGADLFNGAVNNMITSSTTNANGMLRDAIAFNQPVTGWDWSSLLNASRLFQNATAFNQRMDLLDWTAIQGTGGTNMLLGTSFSTANYDLLLPAIVAQAPKTGVTFHAGSAQYSAGGPAAARATLVSVSAPPVGYSWSITDGGAV